MRGSLHAQPLRGVAHVLRGMMATGVPAPNSSATMGGCLSTKRARSYLLPTAIFLLATTVIVCRPAHPSDDSVRTQCPGAAAWREKHPQFSTEAIAERDKARTISKPELLQELRRRADEDQTARHAYKSQPSDSNAQATVRAVDAANLTWLRQLFSRWRAHGPRAAR